VDADRRTQGVAIGKFADHVLVVDVRFVLDSIQDLNVHSKLWGGHIDMLKVGIVGHSMGGTTAALATKEDPRILAGVNLDGSNFPGMNEDIRPIELHKPLLFLATEEHASGEGRAREYSGSDSETYYVVVPGTDHMSFTDKRLIQSHFSLESQSGSKSSESALLAIETTRFLVEQFLAKYLQAKPVPGLDLLVRVDKK
jgi:predicted dienelactone hydrolase